MNNELNNMLNNSQRANKQETYISLLKKRENVLNALKSTKSQYLKRDLQKHLAKLNDQIGKIRKELYGLWINTIW